MSAASNQSPALPIGNGGSGPGPSCVSQTRLHQDISRLRVDKLELLRQALSAQHEVRQLRQREAQLETDLALAAAEIRRLKNQLKSNHGVPGSSSISSSEANCGSHQKNISTTTPEQQNTTQTSRRTVQMHIPL